RPPPGGRAGRRRLGAGRPPPTGRGCGAALMSLYRSPARRSVRALVGVGGVALLVGGAVGYLIGHGGQSSPTLTAGLAQVQKTVRPAVDGIELVGVEYPIGVKDGKVVVPEQLQGAKDQLAK